MLTIYSGNHTHFLLENNDILYVSAWKWQDVSSIVLIHTAFDGAEEVLIDVSAHSPVRNASLMHNGAFTFLHAFEYADVDVLKLTGSPSAGMDELSTGLQVYPNPISIGELVTVDSLQAGRAQVLTMDGRLVQSVDLISGKNFIETSDFTSGVYIISCMNETHRIVVK